MANKGGTRIHKEMRKVVPKFRRFNRSCAADLISMKAYEMDTTRAELGAACNPPITDKYVNQMLITQKRVKPNFIKQFCETLGMTEEETRRVYHAAAVEAGYNIGPYRTGKQNGEEEAQAD